MVGGIENRGESMPKTPQESPTQPESQGGRGGHQGAQDGSANRPDVRRPSDPGRGLEEASAGRSTRYLRQRPRAGTPAVRRRERRAVQTDRPAKSGVGLSQKKSWPYRLTTNGNGSIRLTGASAFNSSANCWECRARPTTISRSQRVQKTCDCSASSTNCI